MPPADWKCTCHGKTVQELDTELEQMEQRQASQAQRKVQYDLHKAAAEAMPVDSEDLATKRDQLLYRLNAIRAAADAIHQLTNDKEALNDRKSRWIVCWGNLSPPNA